MRFCLVLRRTTPRPRRDHSPYSFIKEPSHVLPRAPRRRRVVWAAAAVAVVLVSAVPVVAQPHSDAETVRAKADSVVLDSVTAGEESGFFVVLKQRADLAVARGKRGHAAKGRAASEELRAEAGSSQKPVPVRRPR
ncbi:hypothetical protein ACIQRK_06915 [Streptomyces anulatus]